MRLSVTSISPPLKYLPVWQDYKAKGKTGGNGMCINILKQARCMEFCFTFHTRIQNSEYLYISRNHMALPTTLNTSTVIGYHWSTQLKVKSFTILPRKDHLELPVLITWQVIISKGHYITFEVQRGHQSNGLCLTNRVKCLTVLSPSQGFGQL